MSKVAGRLNLALEPLVEGRARDTDQNRRKCGLVYVCRRVLEGEIRHRRHHQQSREDQP